jgi:hypothetical protein
MNNLEDQTPKVRKQLSADALIGVVRKNFKAIYDPHEQENEIALSDALMSGFAMFSLKDPSLLAFDRRRVAEEHNLKSIYKLEKIPCDTQMRTRLDEVDPNSLRPAYADIFRKAQRGKVLESMVYMEEGYIVSVDGTGDFSSDKLSCPYCMEKTHKNGKITYYLQELGAAIVHPERREVIPLPPEPIRKQDGQTKNDCERNAARRWLEKFREDHPHLKVIIVEDGLSPNGPHIRDLIEHHCHYILSCKENDHTYLFSHLDIACQEGRSVEHSIADPTNPEMRHFFRFTNGVPLNESNQDIQVNVLEYWEENKDETKYFCWVTDLFIAKSNVYQIMRAGRSRWKVENEVFNTLKNQGYHMEHNYGLGEKNLHMVFVSLMMLAFLADQIQQLSCSLFRAAWKKYGSKQALWENIRSIFRWFAVESMEMLYRVILAGQQKPYPVAVVDSS